MGVRARVLGVEVLFSLIPPIIPLPGFSDRLLFCDWVIPLAQQLRPYILERRKKIGQHYRSKFDYLARECKVMQLLNKGYKLRRLRQMSLDELLAIEPFFIFREKGGETNEREEGSTGESDSK
ncbi:MAG: hypothetical protein QXZ09_05980 [Candidatus Methanomethylicaceae archaeon]